MGIWKFCGRIRGWGEDVCFWHFEDRCYDGACELVNAHQQFYWGKLKKRHAVEIRLFDANFEPKHFANDWAFFAADKNYF